MTIELTSDAYILAAAEALGQAGRASADAMLVHTARATALLDMARLLAEREAAQLAPPGLALPAAFLDCHERRWERGGDDGEYFATEGALIGEVRRLEYVREMFGPLREVK